MSMLSSHSSEFSHVNPDTPHQNLQDFDFLYKYLSDEESMHSARDQIRILFLVFDDDLHALECFCIKLSRECILKPGSLKFFMDFFNTRTGVDDMLDNA